MTQTQHRHPAPVSSMPHGEDEYPRMPQPAQAPGSRDAIAAGRGELDRGARAVEGTAAAAASHRERLSSAFPGQTIVVAGCRAPARVNYCPCEFSPHSDFVRLTGCTVEDAVLARRQPALTGGHTDRALARRAFEDSRDLARALSELRMVKDEWEIDQLRRAVDATVLGFRETVTEIPVAAESGGERRLFHRAARILGR